MAKPNWKNKTIWTADNLAVMRGMNSESIDLIYLYPPFNSNANYAAPIGSKAAGAEFKDTWTLDDVDVEWINLKRTDLGRLPKYNCAANKTKLYGEQGGNCAGCKTHFEKPLLEVDHIITTSKGGTDHISNLQLLCPNCNKIKGNRGMEHLIAQLQL